MCRRDCNLAGLQQKATGMKENTTNNTGLWIAGGFLLLATGVFFYVKNKRKRDARDTSNENKALDDLSSSDTTTQAALLKKYLSVNEVPLVGFVANPATANPYGCLNVANEITDYPTVQQKFSALCENRYTLQRALETGLSDSDYTNFADLLKRQKVVTTDEAKAYALASNTAEISSTYKQVPAGVILGSLMKSGYYGVKRTDGNIEYVSAYMFFNGFDANRQPVWAFIEKDDSELITPK